ncbi:hypothetical protein [Streptomyces sp. RG80]|uniref:hypothetical protein n=1 Tax=Streptomyces sp. RG80 TaxID=3157340 RepID=UPI0033904028
MSGAKEPATNTDGTSELRPVPSVRKAGSTAAAWLSVNGKKAPGFGLVGPAQYGQPVKTGREQVPAQSKLS